MSPTAWLLLKGLVRERRQWGTLPERLRAAGDEVTLLDLPGVGTERHRRSPTTITAIVDDLRARWLRSRGHGDRPWRLFAPSLGGMIALRWAERWPDDLAGVAVCNTSAKDVARPLQRFSPEALRTLLRAVPAAGVARERHILQLVSNTEHGRAHAVAFAEAAADAPLGVGLLLRQLWAGSGARTPERVRAPVLVLASLGDRLCHPDASRALAARLHAPLRVHPSGGHDLALDDPDWVVAELRAWVADTAPGKG
jgi:alpha-beta hydrolase superfamily lysophospholipase